MSIRKKWPRLLKAAKAKQEGESGSADESGATSEGEENTRINFQNEYGFVEIKGRFYYGH